MFQDEPGNAKNTDWRSWIKIPATYYTNSGTLPKMRAAL
jgi:hypothetical protein